MCRFNEDSGDEGDFDPRSMDDEGRLTCIVATPEYGTRAQMLTFARTQLLDLAEPHDAAGMPGACSPRAAAVPLHCDGRPETAMCEMVERSIEMVRKWEASKEGDRANSSRLGRRAYNQQCRSENIAPLPLVRSETPLGGCALEYAGYNMGARAARSVAAAMQVSDNAPELHKLLLQGNSLGAGGIGALSKAILSRKPEKMQEINLRGNQLVDADKNKPEAATALASLFSRCGGLKHLDLSDNKLGDVALGDNKVGILKAIKDGSRALVTLGLAHTGLTTKGAKACGLLMKVADSKLVELDLSFNLLRGAGSTFISKALAAKGGRAVALKVLHLSQCNLGDRCIAELAAALESTELYLE